MDDQDAHRILRQIKTKIGDLEMIKATFNPHLKKHLMSKYIYGKYSREPVIAEVHLDSGKVIERNVG